MTRNFQAFAVRSTSDRFRRNSARGFTSTDQTPADRATRHESLLDFDGKCACVTVDDSDSLRPSDKSGIIARGDASLPRIRAGIASITVDIDSTTTWNGFRQTTAA